MRQLCAHRHMKHLGSLESTQEARVARGVADTHGTLDSVRLIQVLCSKLYNESFNFKVLTSG